jgi:hypothetical protein
VSVIGLMAVDSAINSKELNYYYYDHLYVNRMGYRAKSIKTIEVQLCNKERVA